MEDEAKILHDNRLRRRFWRGCVWVIAFEVCCLIAMNLIIRHIRSVDEHSTTNYIQKWKNEGRAKFSRRIIPKPFIANDLPIGDERPPINLPKDTVEATNDESGLGIPARDAVWQPVGGASDKFYVYSAYYDRRENLSTVRVIGATARHRPDPVLCKLWYPNTNRTYEVSGKIAFFREHNRLFYAACFITCSFAMSQVPQSASIVTSYQQIPENNITVIDSKHHDKTNQKSKTIGICVKPLHYTYNKSIQLVEFMELNRILGIDHVTFYNSSISPTTDCILRNYMDEGRVTVLPWASHFKSQIEIRTENLIASLNDCLYRNKHNFTYLAFLDMDEFIMPRWNYTLQQLVETLDGPSSDHTNSRKNTTDLGSFTFRNGFFYLQWADEPAITKSQDAYEKSLTTLLKTRRKLELHKHGDRSKYIVKPTKVTVVGNHEVWSFVPGYRNLEVQQEQGILHHYRVCEYGGNNCINRPYQIDRTVFRYKPHLIAAVKDRWQKLQRKCGVQDIQQASTKSQYYVTEQI